MFYLPMEQHPIFCILHDCAGVCVSACPWRLRDLPRLCSPWCHGWRGAAAERSSSGPSLGTWLCLQLIVGRGGRRARRCGCGKLFINIGHKFCSGRHTIVRWSLSLVILLLSHTTAIVVIAWHEN